MQTQPPVDLRSDTVTRPTEPMRRAMAEAPVGDDVMDEDPTVNALQAKAAERFGKEAALYVPSGTMANLTALLSQTRPGDAAIFHEAAHPLKNESANLAMVGGLLPIWAYAEGGVLSVEDVEPLADTGEDHHHAPTTLLGIENTHNAGGGSVYPLEKVNSLSAWAHDRGMRLHCDGARIFNAVVASGVPAAEYAAPCDTVSFCLSKGLGCPVGSLVAGDAETIKRAHRYRKMLGGGMRQAGIIAAAGIYALDHHVERLAEDHARARRFREALEGATDMRFPLPSPTNMVYAEVDDAPAYVEALKHEGVLVLDLGPRLIRMVFHLDIDDAQTDRAVEAFKRVESVAA